MSFVDLEPDTTLQAGVVVILNVDLAIGNTVTLTNAFQNLKTFVVPPNTYSAIFATANVWFQSAGVMPHQYLALIAGLPNSDAIHIIQQDNPIELTEQCHASGALQGGGTLSVQAEALNGSDIASQANALSLIVMGIV